MAGCPRCSAPLIATFAFSGHEFYCLECGRHVTFFGPVGLPAAEHQARYDVLKAEWDAHVGGSLLVRGGVHTDCPLCAKREDYDHAAHASAEERAAHEAALAWLAERASQ